MTREKRQFTRFTLNVPTILSMYQVEAYHTGSIANISMGGCFFPVGETLPVGEECQVTITVGEGILTEKISLPGQIVRSDVNGVGIMFTDNSPGHHQQLKRLIAQYTNGSQRI